MHQAVSGPNPKPKPYTLYNSIIAVSISFSIIPIYPTLPYIIPILPTPLLLNWDEQNMTKGAKAASTGLS